MRLQTGTFLQGDKYRIIDVLGQGGFGITYLAEQVMAERKVCIKEFFPKEYYNRDEDSRSISLGSQGSAEIMDLYKAKFIKEAKTIAKLDHPNIIHIFDVFAENNTAYYVMEYIEGESLSALVKERGALSESEAVGYIKQVAAALGNIHEQRIMHLDIKPANIMLRKADGKPVLIDFGLSKQYDAEGNQTSSTPVGISAGYAPMEQYQQGGVKEFSPETDIYSLGATLYYLVTGCVPPQAAAIVDDGLPELPAHLSANVRNAIERSMEIQRKSRPQNVNELLALLDSNVDDEATRISPNDATTDSSKHEEQIAETPKPEQKTKIAQKAMSEKNKLPKSKRIWGLIVVAVVAIIGIITFTCGDNDSSDGAENVADNYAEMIAQGLGRDGIYMVGDYYNRDGKKGVVFEVWDGGRHGKIVSLNEAHLPWCTVNQYNKNIKVGTSDHDNGKVNTDKVMRLNSRDEYTAFVWCRELGEEWYLPAVQELVTLSHNYSMVDMALEKHGVDMNSGTYISSTEHISSPTSHVWDVYIGYSNDPSSIEKKSHQYVRAVSTF